MAGRIAYALGVFLVFGVVAIAIGWSANADWREGRREHDNMALFFAARQWWPALIAAAFAIAGPIVIIVRG